MRQISCDEFPFSSSLEGGAGNVVLLAVTNAEQDLQGTLQSSITYLRKRQNDGRTSWSKASQCHRYQIKLVDAVPAGAAAGAIGSLDAGSQFFATKGVLFKYVTNKNTLKALPPTFAVDTPYDPSQTAMTAPKISKKFNCAPCPASPSPSPSAPDLQTDEVTTVGTPSAAREFVKRQAASCSVPPGPPLPTTSAEASAVAAASASSASAAAAAAIAALASASNPSAAEAAAAAAAISAANVLGPAAAAMVRVFSAPSFTLYLSDPFAGRRS